MKHSVMTLLLTVSITLAQDATRPRFEVASVKETPTHTEGGSKVGSPSPGYFRARDVSLRLLCRIAYEIDTFNIFGGPGWIDSAGFDIDAKAPVIPGQSRADELQIGRVMLQALLENRFHLRTHVETRDLPIYVLTVAKSGLKMKHAPCDPIESACLAQMAEAMKMWPSTVTLPRGDGTGGSRGRRSRTPGVLLIPIRLARSLDDP